MMSDGGGGGLSSRVAWTKAPPPPDKVFRGKKIMIRVEVFSEEIIWIITTLVK